MDVINLRFAIPLSVNETEVHYAYFSHLDDDAEMERHRVRQSSNLLGPCGLVSMEDASVFHRVHIGNHTPGVVTFQKGVKNTSSVEQEFKQNDESGNLPRWDYYRRSMGFERQAV
jgi:anthranilate 1,2-dioxygenase large subunit